MPSFQTKRLMAKPLENRHWENWLALGSDKKVMTYLGGTWPSHVATTKFNENLAHWQKHGYGQYLFFRQSDGIFVGRSGIRKMFVDNRWEYELGYSVVSDLWRQGYGFEMAKACLLQAKNIEVCSSVVAFTSIENKISERIIQKLGFTFEKHISYSNQPHVLYRYLLSAAL